MQFGIELIILTILTSLLSLVLHFSEMKQSWNHFKQIVQGRCFNFDLNEFILKAKFKSSISDNLLKVILWSFCLTKTKVQNACGSL